MCKMLENMIGILKGAPWLNHDLLANLILGGIGFELIVQRDLFSEFGGMYASMGYWANEWQWGIFFLLLGLLGLIATLSSRSLFWLRLLGRMGTAFGFLTLMGNHLSHRPLPAATVGYLFIALWSLWGLVRTTPDGR